MKKGIKFFGFILSILMGGNLYAQQSDDLYIFGFSQTLFSNKLVDAAAFPYPADNPTNGVPLEFNTRSEANSFSLHQLNLFFRKPISERTTFFLNLEATGSYSTQNQSGNFQIPEGWLSYNHSEKLTLKMGLLIPRFNNLNEIKNRLPLFPYLIRPTIYEALFNGVFISEDYLPERAYFQMSGDLPLYNKYLFDYAFYVGNSESSYSSNNQPGEGSLDDEEAATIYKGENLTTQLSYGARLGLKNIFQSFKIGLSATYDHDNRNETAETSFSRLPDLVMPAFGDVSRYRIGTDLSFSYKKFTFEGEYIGVFHNHSEIHKTPQYRNADLNKYFYYGVLTYNFSEKMYSFIGHNKFADNSYEFLLAKSADKAGITYDTIGGGWRPMENVVFKFQYSLAEVGENPHADAIIRLITAGVSVIF